MGNIKGCNKGDEDIINNQDMIHQKIEKTIEEVTHSIINVNEDIIHIPEELLWKILLYLKLPDILSIIQIIKNFFNVTKNDNFWKDLCEIQFPFINTDRKKLIQENMTWKENLQMMVSKDNFKYKYLDVNNIIRRKGLLKIVVIGEDHVGKTVMMKRYVMKKFEKRYKATIGADFLSKELEMKNNETTDTAGQERFKSLGNAFYRGSDACIACFDLTDRKTWEKLKDFTIPEFWKLSEADKSFTPLTIVGCKKDLICKGGKKCGVEFSEIYKFMKKDETHKLLYDYAETSSKTGENIDELFDFIVRKCIYLQKFRVLPPIPVL